MAKISVYQQTVDRLQENIFKETWKPGQRLPTMKQLAKEMGVSVTTMREALKSLENRDMISIEHGRGIYVRNDPNAVTSSGTDKVKSIPLLELLQARLLFEPQQAYMCAKNANQAIKQQLQELSEKMDKEMRSGGDFLDADLRFHQVIADGAGQAALKGMSDSLANYQRESRERTNTLPNMRTKASLYHQLIATAISSDDADEAKQLMAMHIEAMIVPLKKIKKENDE